MKATNWVEGQTALLLKQLNMDFLTKGWPDFLIHDSERGLIFTIEVKSKTDKLTPEQRMVHRILEAGGVPTIVFRPDDFSSLDEAKKSLEKEIDQLNKWGINLGEVPPQD